MEKCSPPIYSSREDDPDLTDEIGAFVVSLAECVDTLQDVQMSGDFEQLGEKAVLLRQKAVQYGYAPLAEVAKTLYESCGAEKDGERQDETREAMLELTELSRRIRQGHRGAA